MKRSWLVPHAKAVECGFAAVVLAGILLTNAPARADIDVQIDIRSAPPAPIIAFRARPHERRFAGELVYVVDDASVGDNDCFRYDGYYWLFRGGYWYRSTSWRSRFVVVAPRYVPTVFYRLPRARWKHHPNGPPGLAKRSDGRPPGHMKGARGNDKHGGRGRR